MNVGALLKESKYTVQDFLETMGLNETDINILKAEIKLEEGPQLPLKRRIGSLPVNQLYAIGAAIARKQNRLYLDAEERQPLSFPENAFHFGYQQFEKFFIAKRDLEEFGG